MQFMGLIEEFTQDFLEQSKRMYRIPYKGAHLIIHSLKDKPHCIEHDMTAGIYTLVNKVIERVRDGKTYRDIKSPDEWCVLGNLPKMATEIFQEARFAMIQTRKSVLDGSLQQLESYASTFVNELQGRCKILPFNGGRE
jgi:sarcosine oxidase gamma subunit